MRQSTDVPRLHLTRRARTPRNLSSRTSPRPRSCRSEAAAPPGRSGPGLGRAAQRGGGRGETKRGTGPPFQAGRRCRAGSDFRPSSAFSRSRSSAAAAPRSRACAGIAAVPSLPTSRPYLIKKGEEGARGPLCRAEAGGQGRADLPGNRGGGRAPAGRGGAGRAGAAVGARTRRRWGRCGRPGGLSRGGGRGRAKRGDCGRRGFTCARPGGPNGAANALRRAGRCSEGESGPRVAACDSLAGAVLLLGAFKCEVLCLQILLKSVLRCAGHCVLVFLTFKLIEYQKPYRSASVSRQAFML